MTGWIGISLGDVTGVGPEVALKAVAAEAGRDDTKYLFIGDENILRRLNQKLVAQSAAEKIFQLRRRREDFSSRIRWLNRCRKILPAGSPLAANAAVALACATARNAACAANWTRSSPRRSTRNPSSAPATNFVGQTEFLSELAGTKRTAMMLLGHDEHERWLRVALATVHISHQIRSRKIDGGKNHARHRTRRASLPRSADCRAHESPLPA